MTLEPHALDHKAVSQNALFDHCGGMGREIYRSFLTLKLIRETVTGIVLTVVRFILKVFGLWT